MTLRVGVIGCGGIGTSKHLPSLTKLEDVEIVAVCDIIVERAVDAKKEFGTEDTEIFADYKEMLEKVELDVVHVCTPNNTHAELSIASLEAGAHVMCEKPMAKTAEEARAMLEASKRTGKKLTIGYQNRFRPDAQHLHQLVEDGELGNVYFAKAHAIRRRAVPTWGVFLDEEAQGGGPLIDIGTHALDLTLWTMNNYKPKYVVGNTFHELAETKNAANAWGPWDPAKFTVEDSAFGYVVMENGAAIFLEAAWALNTRDVKEAKTTLMGDKAGADMETGLTINGERHGLTYDQEVNLNTGGVAFYEGVANKPELIEARQWIDAIKNDTQPTVLPEQALVVTEILEAIYESAKTGKPVFFNQEGEE